MFFFSFLWRHGLEDGGLRRFGRRHKRAGSRTSIYRQSDGMPHCSGLGVWRSYVRTPQNGLIGRGLQIAGPQSGRRGEPTRLFSSGLLCLDWFFKLCWPCSGWDDTQFWDWLAVASSQAVINSLVLQWKVSGSIASRPKLLGCCQCLQACSSDILVTGEHNARDSEGRVTRFIGR